MRPVRGGESGVWSVSGSGVEEDEEEGGGVWPDWKA